MRVRVNAYSKTAHEDHGESLEYSSTSDHPRVPDKHHQTENMLNGWQIDAEHNAQLRSLQSSISTVYGTHVVYRPQYELCLKKPQLFWLTPCYPSASK